MYIFFRWQVKLSWVKYLSSAINVADTYTLCSQDAFTYDSWINQSHIPFHLSIYHPFIVIYSFIYNQFLMIYLSTINSIYLFIDLFKTQTLYWFPFQILTKDSVTVTVDAVVYYRINNPYISVMNVSDANKSTRLLAMTTLRNILGTKTLTEILSERDSITSVMQASIHHDVTIWKPLQWRHNERDAVSTHRRLDCLLNRLFRRRSKKISKLRVTGLCEGNPPVTGGFPLTKDQ